MSFKNYITEQAIQNPEWNLEGKHPAYGTFKLKSTKTGGGIGSIVTTFTSGKRQRFKTNYGNENAEPYEVAIIYSKYSSAMHRGSALNPEVMIAYKEFAMDKPRGDVLKVIKGQESDIVTKKAANYVKKVFGIDIPNPNKLTIITEQAIQKGDRYKDKDGLLWRVTEIRPDGVKMELIHAPKAWGHREFFITNKELPTFKRVTEMTGDYVVPGPTEYQP